MNQPTILPLPTAHIFRLPESRAPIQWDVGAGLLAPCRPSPALMTLLL